VRIGGGHVLDLIAPANGGNPYRSWDSAESKMLDPVFPRVD